MSTCVDRFTYSARDGPQMMISSVSPVQYTAPARSLPSEDTPFRVDESPIRSDSASAPTAAADTVEISGQEAVPPYAAMYGPPVMGQSPADEPANRLGARPGGLAAAAAEEEDEGVAAEPSGEGDEDGDAVAARDKAEGGQDLSEDEQRQVQELQQRDREVRQHEQAHKSTGGQYAGAMSYEYQQGPDGKRYAVGGEVAIDISKERDPETTAAKMRQVRAAALAPANTSSQDLSVAAQASQLEAEARQEASKERSAAMNGDGGEPGAAEAGESEGEDGQGAASASGAASQPSPTATAGAAEVSEAGPAVDAGSPLARLASAYAGSAMASPFYAARQGDMDGVRSRLDVVA